MMDWKDPWKKALKGPKMGGKCVEGDWGEGGPRAKPECSFLLRL